MPWIKIKICEKYNWKWSNFKRRRWNQELRWHWQHFLKQLIWSSFSEWLIKVKGWIFPGFTDYKIWQKKIIKKQLFKLEILVKKRTGFDGFLLNWFSFWCSSRFRQAAWPARGRTGRWFRRETGVSVSARPIPLTSASSLPTATPTRPSSPPSCAAEAPSLCRAKI